ncbi:DUF1285 domain-containing protein [Spongiibacter sp. KMU-166]|uniref:DUF1285 domain-containing protein n=1 Tax=Spongiibacter thalassae TaxID=2721624 RepID=A0ABX1GEJ3_9GAMM|nr:DUF1285 domain-containing protein [Spongiibacter thalassae]NKI17341.1 DUF1285 domain-containing protein [Spongiibacter thalassae]
MSNLEQLEKLLKDQRGQPPIEKWQPELSGDIDIRLCADGRWIHEGGEIKRHELVKLFASILRREEDGEYYLVTPVEKWRVQVEDLPLLVVDFEVAEADQSGAQRIVVKTNVDSWFELGENHPLKVEADKNTDEPRPAVLTRHGLWARINRASFYRLVELAEQDGEELVLRTSGGVFSLGRLS